jgi:HPt (histidine-containing phosphotransfer) domain-containing protein
MGDDRSPLSDLEARLEKVRRFIVEGLPDRASVIREAADRLAEGDDSARDELQTAAHKLRGTIGTFGYQALCQLANDLEDTAASAAPDAVVRLARRLADAAQEAGSGE